MGIYQVGTGKVDKQSEIAHFKEISMWTVWTTFQTILVALGLLLVYGGDQLARPVLLYAGMTCLGLGVIVMGLEAIVKRRIIRWKRGRAREAYTGIPAILRGIQFNFVGLFLIGAAIMMQFNNGREIFLQTIRRPGPLLVLLGGLCFLQMLIILSRSSRTIDQSQGLRLLNLVVARLFPGLIWLVFGLALLSLGVFDILAPTRFDEMGGRILEELYRAR